MNDVSMSDKIGFPRIKIIRTAMLVLTRSSLENIVAVNLKRRASVVKLLESFIVWLRIKNDSTYVFF